MPTAPDLLRPADVVRTLGVSRSWLYQAAKDGRIPSIRLGGPDGPLRFHADDLDRWIDAARAGWQPAITSAETLRRHATAIRHSPAADRVASTGQLRLGEG